MTLTSLSARLLMIVTLSLLPVFGFQIYTERDASAVRQQLMQDEVLRLLHVVLGELQEIVDGSEQVLNVIAGSEEVQDNQPASCARLLSNLLKASPRYSNASVVGQDGKVICAPSAAEIGIDVSDRAFFRTALATGGFAIGEYTIGRGSRQPTIQMGRPFFRRDGVIGGVVQVSLSLVWLEKQLHDFKLPAGSIVTIADHNGTFLARLPGGMRYVGQTVADDRRYLLAGDTIHVYRSLTSMDNGRTVVAAISPSGANPHGLEASVALDEETSFSSVTQANRTGLALIVLGAVLSLVLTAILGTRLIRRPVKRLLDVADRWARGELTARTGLRDDSGEFGRLAVAFETMATTLDARENALRQLSVDLEARVEAEVAAREFAQARAAQAERMQTLGQLAGGIAHDINNVLQAVRGAVMLIMRRPDDTARVQRFARMADEAIERGSSVTRRLLTIGRRGDLRAEAIDLPGLLAGLEEILTYTLGAGIAVRTVVPETLPRVVADKGQLETVLINLATNARDAMPQGGSLIFRAEPEVMGLGGREHPSGLRAGSYVRLDVTDTGDGMDAATVDRAREPFFTTKEPGSGTGLGLSMAYGFAEQSGGSLAISSRPGSGTTVTLWLPQATTAFDTLTTDPGAPVAAAQADGGPDEQDPGGHEGSGRILLVDDETMVREVLAWYLTDAGYLPLTAANGPEALGLLAAGERVDAVITDLSMPGMDGLALIRAVRKRDPDMPVILLTGYAKDITMPTRADIHAGGIALLRKPVTDVQLLDQLSAVLAVRRALTPGRPRVS